jgi:hypothetical protein
VILRLVLQTQFAKKEIVQVLALVCQTTLEIPILAADLSVLKTLIAIDLRLVLTRNAEILAQEFVETMHNVKS